MAGEWGTDSAATGGVGKGVYKISELINVVQNLTNQAKLKIEEIQTRGEDISIADMFDMQMNMNHLAQMSEMSTSIVNATNTAVMSMARNVKG